MQGVDALNKLPKPFSNHDWDKFRSLEGMVRLVLITVWDPIGVFGYSQALDEYDNYVLGVVGLLISGASLEDVEAHLLNVQQSRFDFKTNEFVRAKVRTAAEALCHMYANYTRFED